MKRTLDRIDCEIIDALQNNARLSNKELANQVKLAPSTCLGRVKRLQDEKILQGFHAAVDSDALGIGLQAMIAVRLSKHTRASFKSLQAHMMSREEVVAM
jgi:DNA-binding Lrp family transcriptional regulator